MKIIAKFIVIGCLVFNGCGEKPTLNNKGVSEQNNLPGNDLISATEVAPYSYRIFLSVQETTFYPDKVSINITGTDVIGTIRIYLNEDKISEWTIRGGVMLFLDAKDGENVLRLEGKSKAEIHMMVCAHKPIVKDGIAIGYKDGHILIRKLLIPGQLEAGFVYRFKKKSNTNNS